MNIYIKSFNRPYFLDRCLYSIDRYLTGDYQVVVMDDGTPEKYVQRIKEKYAYVVFSFTETSESKRKEIRLAGESGMDHFTKYIPLSFSRDCIKKSSDIFLLLEDDIWLTALVDVNTCVDVMKQKKDQFA